LHFDINKYGKVTVIGAARSGIAAAKLLKKKGADVLLSDINTAEIIDPEIINELKEYGIRTEFGAHSDEVFDCKLMVVSPGVPQNAPVIKKALEKAIEVVSEIEIGFWFCKGKTVAITGTNGKTTTTTLIGEICSNAGKETWVCGNIGTAFCDVADKISSDGIAVIEVSSFQLDNIKYFKPLIALILNITPDHLDRYNHRIEEYIDSKNRVYENQDSGDYFVYNFDDVVIKKSLKHNVKSSLAAFSLKKDVKNDVERGAYLDNYDLLYFYYQGEENVIDTQKLIIKGQHNVYNSMASVITAKLLGIEKSVIQKTLVNFKGVEHRLEFVRDLNGIKFYNDSKATNVNSVWYALQGFNEPIILILGGRDKGNDYSEIEAEVKKYVKHIVAIGESKQKVFKYFKNIKPVTLADTMEDAVYKAAGKAFKNEIVLLSPACASFDMFDNYEQRGMEFKKIVNNL
jgi:UDP-N-acetylmuramoylalanine--D-glutamate ligase